jgi:transcriptional regulator
MHPNAAFRTDEQAVLLARLAARPLATLSAAVDGRLLVAHAPVMARRLGDGLALDFHLSRSNALAAAIAAGFRAVAVSVEAESYISPDWYADADQVPTWNYVSVEAEGPVVALDDEGLVALLDDLSAQGEARLLPKTPWTRHKMSPGRFEAMTRAIIGARMTVERLEGTTKLSQNKSDADLAAVVAALGDHPIGRLMASHLGRS